MRFGSQVVFSSDGNLLITKEEKYFDFNTVRSITRNTESVKTKNTKAALAEFLKLMDRFQAGEIEDFSIECITGNDGKLLRVEKTWTVPDLR